ncbi:hypothetical protein [Salirhabdus sp. Marseille-P4669]|uniref:hypothetical protein n=1 Tax=Salirhabdus sp. Marseille-P4669 TaxID=2042310 RepID=UPI000C79B9C9|nr:hypothetical protein [Salirhabdus sp. Marseille-P4669]
MNNIFEKLIYYVFTILFFIVLWKITGEIWEAFVPYHYKTELLALVIVIPLLIVFSFILSSLTFKVIKSSNS